jgi:glutathione synthase/RimK-type ligase-like ATP-grasp enzyme
LRELENEGIALVPTHWLEAGSVEKVENAMLAAFPGMEKVIKPLKSAGAFHTYRFVEESLPNAAPFVGRPAMIQPFVREILSEGERSLVFFGGEFSHAIAKRPRAGDFRIQEEFGGRFSAFTPDASETAFAKEILDSVARRFAESLEGKPLLYARVDYVRIGGKPKLMELELLEPDLYLHHAPGSAERFESALRQILG